jgi:hypothetical protein
MEVFEPIKTTKNDDESIKILIHCMKIAMKQYYPKIKTIEDVEEVAAENVAIKNATPIVVSEKDETLKPVEQISLSVPLVIEEREYLQPISSIKEIDKTCPINESP